MAAEDYSYLLQANSEKHRRARNWTDAEMKTLLSLWEKNFFELRKSKRNAKIYEKMSQRFFSLTGEHRPKEEIKMKITNMSFQYRRQKCMTAKGMTIEWPYYKAIEKIFTKITENGQTNELERQSPGPSTSSQPENLLSQPETICLGFLPEYTGTSDEKEMKEEEDEFSVSSASVNSPELSSVHVPHLKRRRLETKQQSLKRRKLRVMEAMLVEQKKVSRAVEETCREVRRVMHQQNLHQVQSLQLQDRMMNLLEKMIQLPTVPPKAWAQGGAKETGQS
ncbi:myb/SANT-like DNA-binding domain-containing protein 1 [Hypomesus transpacificus]|uniref:myb/SANT-like DNA-binding domain-containing protein 1 n=1 Tax=Hypomesus transpacificus TaxID=137520 RepID=UPI001F08755B|nr:myb/SANT-like DNA-binding domain-containing protein 1 [Hypomesus transpacificus]